MPHPSEFPDDSLLVTQRQAARMLGCSIDVVRRLSRQGELPLYRRAQNVVVAKRADVLAFIERMAPADVDYGHSIPERTREATAARIAAARAVGGAAAEGETAEA
jgi:hypothetical protein